MIAEDLAVMCYEAYDIITGSPLEDRDNEGDFPEQFYKLMERFNVDPEDFQKEWDYHAG